MAAGEELVALMVAYQQGDLGAFEQLFDALAPQLRGYLLALCRDADRADDLLQETFLQMHRSRHTYSPPRPVKPWAFGIARYVHLMDRRARTRKLQHERVPWQELPELPVSGIAERIPAADGLARALERIPDDRREALLLHHVWGFSFREIGAMLGISERAAKLRSFRGIQSLREILGQEGGE